MKKPCGLVLALSLLLGCATLSKDQCLKGQWRQIGFRDGTKGYSEDRWESHVKACARYASPMDQESYLKGRQQGLLHYCTPENGFRVGRNGETYHHVCPPPLERDFLRAYNRGLEGHRIEERINAVKKEIGRLEDDLEDKTLSVRERIRLRKSLERKNRELDSLNRSRERFLLHS